MATIMIIITITIMTTIIIIITAKIMIMITTITIMTIMTIRTATRMRMAITSTSMATLTCRRSASRGGACSRSEFPADCCPARRRWLSCSQPSRYIVSVTGYCWYWPSAQAWRAR
jgi:hypothetical protein